MAVEQVGIELIVEGMQQVLKQLGTVDKSINELGGTAQKSSSILDGALATALGVGIVKAAEAAIDAIFKLGAAFVGFAAESFDMAVDFQSSLVGLEIAASATGLSYDTLHAATIQVGGDTTLLGVSASGAAEAMTNLFKAGLTNVEVFGDLNGYMAGTAELGGALRASIDLAAASELDMVQASELAAVALSTYGAQLETAEERAKFVNTAMNNYVQAADASVASVSSLAEAQKMVAPTAAAVGYAFEDVNNALAVFSTRGIEGSMAGTSLNAMISSLRSPTDAAANYIDKYNIALRDANGNMLPLIKIVGNFDKALQGVSVAERDAALSAIFTTQGLRAMDTLMQVGTAGMNDMADATANAATIQEQAAAYAETYAGKLEAIEGNMETLKIQIGEALLPVATELLGWFGQMIEQYGPMLVSAFESIVASLQPIIEFIGKAITAIATFGAVIGSASDPLHAIRYALITAFGQETADSVMGIITKIQDFVTNVQTAIAPIMQWLSENVKLQDILIVLGAAIAAVVIPALISIIAAAAPVIAVFIAGVAIVAALRAAWENDFGGIRTFVLDVFTRITSFIQENFSLIQAYFTVGLANLQAVWAVVWSAIVMIVSSVWEVIKTVINVALEIVAGVVKAVMQAVTGDWEGAWETVKETAAAVWEAIKEGVVAFINNVLEKMGTTMETVKATWKSNWESLVEIAGTIWERIKETVSTAIESVKAFFTNTDWGAVGKSIIDGIAAGITAAAGAIASAASAAAQAALDAAKSLLGIKSPSSVFRDEVGKNIDYGIAAGVADFTPVITKQMGNLTSALLPALGGMTQMLSGLAPASAAGRTTNYNSNANSNSVTNNMIHLTPALALESVGMTIAA